MAKKDTLTIDTDRVNSGIKRVINPNFFNMHNMQQKNNIKANIELLYLNLISNIL